MGLSVSIDSLLSRRKRILIILDEAQSFRDPRGTSMLLAHIYDYYHDELTFLITGSAVGVMKSILDPGARASVTQPGIASPKNSQMISRRSIRNKGRRPWIY